MRATYDDLYAFLKAHYKSERFEGRNDRDYPDYSHIVTRHRMEDLERQGYDIISRHESASGQMIIFDGALSILDTAPWEAP